MSTLSSLTSILGADLASGDLMLVRDISGTPTDKSITISELTSKISASLGATYQAVSEKDQPDGYAGLDGDGNLVGPIILTDYADNTAAGARDEGEIFTVAGELRIGDGATNGGIAVAENGFKAPYVLSPTSSIIVSGTYTLDLDANETLMIIETGISESDITITFNNATAFSVFPIGYRLTLVLYISDPGDSVTVVNAATYLNKTFTSLAAGIHVFTLVYTTQFIDYVTSGYGWMVQSYYENPF